MVQEFNEQLNAAMQLDKLFGDTFGIDALRPEAKLLFILHGQESLSIKQAMSLSGLSYRGFYVLLKRMVIKNLIIVESSGQDRRVRKIRLVKPLDRCFAEINNERYNFITPRS